MTQIIWDILIENVREPNSLRNIVIIAGGPAQLLTIELATCNDTNHMGYTYRECTGAEQLTEYCHHSGGTLPATDHRVGNL